jgi:hypothetical protein
VVHPVLQKDFQNPIRVFGGGPYQGGPSEDRCRTHVAGAAKRSFFDQIVLPLQTNSISFREKASGDLPGRPYTEKKLLGHHLI